MLKSPSFESWQQQRKMKRLYETILYHLSLIPFFKVYHTDNGYYFADVSQFIEYLVCLSANFMTQFFNLKNI